jgi:hypothetical protein
MNFNIDKILSEVSYRVQSGAPDFTNPLHLIILEQVLQERSYPREFIEGLLKSLRNEAEASNKVKKWNIKAKRWVHIDINGKTFKENPDNYSDSEEADEEDGDESENKDGGVWENFKAMTVTKMKKAGMMDDTGKITLPFGKNKLGIRMGKKTGGDYKQRLVDVLNNPVLQEPENAQQLENMLNALEDYRNNPNDPEALQRALDAAKALLATGAIDVSISELGNPPNNYISVRINNAPIYTFDPGPHTDSIVDAARENGIAKRKGASDSSKWKPQAPGGQGLLPEQHKPAEEIGEPLTSLGVGTRGQRYGKGQEARTEIGSTLQSVIDQEIAKGDKSGFSKAELKAMQDYVNLLNDDTMDPEQKKAALKEAFLKLRQSSTEPNEVHKNFGEIHAAAMLSIDFPDGEIIFPMEGNAGFHDFVMVFGDEASGYKVVEFPVKAWGTSKGVGSSWKTIYKSFTFNDTPEADRAQENLNWLADTIGGMSSAAQDRVLDDENDPTTQRTRTAITEMWDSMDEETQQAVLDRINEFLDPPIKSFDELSTRDMYGFFANKAFMQEALYEGAVEPHVNHEETARRARYCYVSDDGTVEVRENSVSCYKFGSPKREKAIEGKPYKRGQVIHTFKHDCPPVVEPSK